MRIEMHDGSVTSRLARMRRHWPLLLVLGLVAFGLIVGWSGRVDVTALLAWGDRVADRPAAIIAVIVIMAVLFTFALPGSLGLWVVAPFHPPPVAVAILLAGSVTGAAGGYAAARWLGAAWVAERGGRVVSLLSRRGDLLTQCMLRVLPGFPHSVVNYASGMLGLPVGPYLLAAVLGLGVKWAVYASAVHGAAEALEEGDPLSADVLLPLFVLAAFLLVASRLRRRL
jgi:uncharacterized membrane protein YdjX (TVP38/TMEM64 family)